MPARAAGPRRLPHALVVVAAIVVAMACGSSASSGGAGSSGGKKKGAGAPPVPVVVEPAVRADVPVVVRGIGTVRALQSAVVRTQVEGTLVDVRFREGQPVKKGALLACIDDRALAAQLASAKAEKARNAAELAVARVDLERYRSLVAQEAIARQQVDQQQALVKQLEARDAANDAAIASAEVALSHTRIVAPFDGRVGLRRVDAGNLVRPTDADGLVAVTAVDPIAVVFTLPQDALRRLRPLLAPDAPAKAPVRVLDRAEGRLLAEGVLVTADNAVDETSGTVTLKAEAPNADGALWPGQAIAVELTMDVLPQAVVVPAQAVRRGPEGPFVFKVVDGKAHVATVKVAYEDATRVALAEGVAPSDVVVVDGHSRLKNGSAVSLPQARTPQAPRVSTAPAGTAPAGGAGR